MLAGLASATRAAFHGPDGALGPRQRRWLVAIVAVAAAARLAWALYAAEEPVRISSGDAYSYYYYGQQLASGHDLVSYVGREPTAYYPIGYPAILAGLFWFVQHTPIPDNLTMAGALLNVVLGTLSVGLVFIIAQRIFGTRVGLVAAAITAVFPNLVFYVATFQLETAFIFLALAAVALLVTHDWSSGSPSRARLIAFGTVLGVSALVRPFSLAFLVGLLVALLVVRSGWRRIVAALCWVAIPLVVLFTPWTIRNLVVMDAPIVFSTNMGDTLCIDRGPGATGRFRWVDHPGCVDPDTPEVERNSGNTRKAIEFVLEHPGQELEQILKRSWYMLEHDHDGVVAVETNEAGPFLGHRLRTALTETADWYFHVALVLAAVGLPSFFLGRRPGRLLVGIAMLSLLVVPLGLWGNVRFHVPALPFLAVAAAVPLAWPWSRRAAHPRSPVEDHQKPRVPAAVGS